MMPFMQYIRRKRVSVEKWIEFHKIDSYLKFKDVCVARGIEPLSLDDYNTLMLVNEETSTTPSVKEPIAGLDKEPVVEVVEVSSVDDNGTSDLNEEDVQETDKDTEEKNEETDEQPGGYEVDDSGFLVVKKKNPFSKK